MLQVDMRTYSFTKEHELWNVIINTNAYIGINFTTYNCTRSLQLDELAASCGWINLDGLQKSKL